MTNFSPHAATINETLQEYKSTENGLTSVDANKRKLTYGRNVLAAEKKQSVLACFFSQFKDFMVIILITAAVVSFVTSTLEGNADYVDPIIILAIIFVNAIIGTYQEKKAEHSLEALKKLSAPTALVLRDKTYTSIPASELVPGDIVKIESGDLIPADCRLINCNNLSIDESALTGESIAISKNYNVVVPVDSVIGDHINMIFSSSIVLNGHGKAIVTSTGSSTEVGKIAKMISEDKAPLTPLQIKLSKTSTILGITAIIICIFIFILGIATGRPVFDMFLTSVSLAVASIPEGLSIIITIMLSLGVTRIAAKNAIIRKLPAVETLGSATYICSDKTGTLTQNKMTVTDIECSNSEKCTSSFVLELVSLCNNSVCQKKIVQGEPTETALINAAIERNISKEELDKTYPRIYEISFDSQRKLMTTVHKLPSGKYRYITKGAYDILSDRCNNIRSSNLAAKNTYMASKALRVIGVAYKDLSFPPSSFKDSEIENGLTLVGIIGMIDPPRKEAKSAVNNCINAGIKPVMITGDHPLTACAIAKELGIISSSERNISINQNTLDKYCITGQKLNSLSDEELNKLVTNYSVFARVSPSHKVRIVKALQYNNHVVAMTGDGVNDAPALKAADIGCSMGIGGTEVAKNASDMILTDDNFATIVDAVKEGRGIYDNIKKSIHFLLSSNIGEIITILIALLFGLPTPLLAVQLLWINLVTDSLPAIALGVEPPEKDIMERKPQPKTASLFSKELTAKIISEGMMIGGLALIAFVLGYKIYPASSDMSLITGRTMAFSVLGLSQIFHAFNMKSVHSLRKINIFNNPKLIFAFIICVILQLSVVFITPLSGIFGVIPLNKECLTAVLILSFLPIPIVELQKSVSSS